MPPNEHSNDVHFLDKTVQFLFFLALNKIQLPVHRLKLLHEESHTFLHLELLFHKDPQTAEFALKLVFFPLLLNHIYVDSFQESWP